MPSLMEILGLKYPLIVAPMAGGPSSPELVAASSQAGALGSIGAAYSSPQVIQGFVRQVRQQTNKPIAINLFAPHPQPTLSAAQIERAMRATSSYRKELELPPVQLESPYEEGFMAQFEEVLRTKPKALSFVFGLLPQRCMEEAKKENIFLIGTATTLQEALALEDAKVDAITLQGIEGGGHRGIFDPKAADEETSLSDLLEQCVSQIKLPLIAAGGIMSAPEIDRILAMGAQAVQMGTAFLACKEAGTSQPYKDKLLERARRKTKTTRVFSGRLARGIENRFMHEMERQADVLLPFPAQNKLTRDLRQASANKGSADFLSLWAGTGEGELWQGSAVELIEQLFAGG